MGNRVPAEVQLLAQRAGCRQDALSRQVELSQIGNMRQDGKSRWMPFRAHQRISADRCAFRWRARTGPAGLVHVRDEFDNDRGSLSVKLLGIVPIARAQSCDELDRGEIMRYLAELAWAPDAIYLNPDLHWRVIDATQLAVSTGHGPRRAEVVFTLDQKGRIAEVFASNRPRAIGKTFVSAAWCGAFSDYRCCDGRMVPMSAEVGWGTGEDYEPVWQGRIVDWRTV